MRLKRKTNAYVGAVRYARAKRAGATLVCCTATALRAAKTAAFSQTSTRRKLSFLLSCARLAHPRLLPRSRTWTMFVTQMASSSFIPQQDDDSIFSLSDRLLSTSLQWTHVLLLRRLLLNRQPPGHLLLPLQFRTPLRPPIDFKAHPKPSGQPSETANLRALLCRMTL